MLKKYAKFIDLLKLSISFSKKKFYTFAFFESFYTLQSVFLVSIVSLIISHISTGNIEKIYFWAFVFLAISLLNLIFSLFKDSLDASLYIEIANGLNSKYLQEYIHLDNTKVEEYGTGKMNNIIFTGVNSMIDSCLLFIDIFAESMSILSMFILILFNSPNIYYFLLSFLLFFFLLFFYRKGILQLFKIRKKVKNLRVISDGKKVKILMSKFEILQNQKINHEIEELSNIYREITKLWWYGNFKKRLWEIGSDITILGFYMILFLIIGVGVVKGNYTLATFTFFVWIVQILSKSARKVRMHFKEFFKSYIDIEKLIEVFETIPQYRENPEAQNFEFKNGNIEFKNLNFGYNEKSSVFKNFNILLEGGKKYAFVGPSGGGKSTLVKLLAGYIAPKSGNIIVDGQKLSSIKLSTYYKNIGYLSQEPSVFDGSIKENLLYALDYEPTKEEIDKIIQLAQCEFINNLAHKLETQIGEKGVKLSGGQKQRLAIAKIMLKNPHIIILDEPTSALDSFNEEEVSKALKNLFKNKTIVVVAHRLQTVKSSDMIFYIENGKIIEQGNHKELLNLKGKYYNMLELQSGF